jgi:hypothetical protein
MSNHNYKYVVVGGGNAAGYVARAFAQSEGFGPGQLLIVTEEPVRGLLRVCARAWAGVTWDEAAECWHVQLLNARLALLAGGSL